ncbi:hypothetical protein ATANTOWER_011021, partial [Ataeniobius toweri]|nr:hypothetical protein [Ataeniobius toweri]
MAGLCGLKISLVGLLMLGLACCAKNQTDGDSKKPEADPKCSYSVKTIQFGLRMKMTDFTPGNYTIKVAEKEGPFERRSTVSFSNENSTHEIKPLKPCTEYELNVTLIA